eukprot:259865-Lingulodinium_polyedra.AAC.1
MVRPARPPGAPAAGPSRPLARLDALADLQVQPLHGRRRKRDAPLAMERGHLLELGHLVDEGRPLGR